MRNIAAALLIACAPFAGQAVEHEMQLHEETTQQIDIDKLSRAFGHLIGKNLDTSAVRLNMDGVIEGIRSGAAGEEAPMTDQEFAEMMAAFQREALKKEAEKNMLEAMAYLKLNKQNPSVVEIEPGKLQYMILEEGESPEVEEGDTPLIQYKGSYIDGTIFGSSEENTGPIAIPLDQTIPGFSKGIVGMKEGERRKLFVHPDLAYGMSGQLAPNAMLIFEVEVIKSSTNDDTATDSEQEDEESDEEDDSLMQQELTPADALPQ